MRIARLLPLVFLAGCALLPAPDTGETTACGDIAARIDSLRRALSAQPDDVEILGRLAASHRDMGTPRSRNLSVEAIDRALTIEPDDPALHLERGLTMLARRFTGEAERCFRRVIDLDPSRCEAWFRLGLIEKRRFLATWRPRRRLEASARLIRHAARLAPADERIVRELAFVELLGERWTDALLAARRLSSLRPDDPDGFLVSAVVHLSYGRSEDAAADFERAFARMSPETAGSYEDISPLLGRLESERYLTLPDEYRIERNETYWTIADPTPSTPLNERRLEHYRRMFLADVLFGDRGVPGAETHRGRSLVRFGPPDGTGTDPGAGLEGPWLVWRYAHPDGDFQLYFQDEFLSGNYHFPISREREGRHSQLALETTPPLFRFPSDGEPFEFDRALAQRRGADDETLVELSVAFAGSLAVDPWESWRLRLTVFDPGWKRIAVVRRFFAPDTLPTSGDRLVCPAVFSIAPRELECSCAIELERPGGRVVATVPLLFRDMHGDRMRMSDLRLLLPMSGGGCADVLDPRPRRRNGDSLRVSYEIYGLRWGRDGRRRRRTAYEIVRLGPERRTGIGGLIDAVGRGAGFDRDREPSIVGYFDQAGSESDPSDRLSIALDGLEPGPYLLRVITRDLVSGIRASAERGFLVTE